MRTLIVTHGFPPLAQGGAELCAYWHATALAREHGDDVLVIAREGDPSRREYAVRRERRDDVSIAWINNTYAATRSFAETYDNPAITAIAAGLVDEFAPEIAHIHHLTGLSTGIVPMLRACGVPCIATLHDYWLLCHRGQLLDLHLQLCAGPEPDGCAHCLGLAGSAPPVVHRAASAFRAVERSLPDAAAKALRGAAERMVSLTAGGRANDDEARARFRHMRDLCAGIDRFVAPSASIRDRFVAFGVPAEKIDVIRNGCPRLPGVPIECAPAPHLRIGFLGSVMVSKGLHVVLEAFRALPAGAATVDVFGPSVPYHGDNSYRTTLAPLMTQPGVRQHGLVPREQISRALAAIDVLVVPSIWPDNAPLVVQEAFLAGVPVVASRIGGLPEMVRDGVSGVLVEPGNVNDLADALRRLATEPGLLSRLRQGIPPVPTVEAQVGLLRAAAEAAIAGVQSRPAAATIAGSSIAAIVLNYGAPDETLLAIRALAASRRRLDRIIVVDNDPSRRCDALVIDAVPGLTYLRAEHNLGFSGGVNLGIRAARSAGATHVLLVNSDAIVPPDAVDRLDRALAASPAAGIAAPLLLQRTAPDVVASNGIDYDAASGRMRQVDCGRTESALAGPAARVVDAASGAVMLISMATIDRVGLFDESYFFSFEEIEFCLRARRAGITTIVTRDAVAFHAGGRSMGPESPRRLYFAARNHLKLATADRAGLRAVPRVALVIGYNFAHAVGAPGGTLIQRVSAVIAGVRDYWRGKSGEWV
ncbi:MAG TPA: glycosyltransferase [Vicinamibacterales bacterium]|nr:glycosyltransferase [Vicinamibacterales bacterium]